MIGFDTEPVVARLKANVTSLRDVQGAAELAAAVKSTTVATPSAFVLLARERAQPVAGGSAVRVQAVDVHFGVVYAVRHYRAAARGTAQSAELTAVRREGFAALLAWQPPGYDQVLHVEYDQGQLLAYDAATVWWQDIFHTRYWSRS